MLGIDMLGGAYYPSHAKKAFRQLHGKWAVGVFWKEFGSAKGFIDTLYRAGCRIFRIHVLWAGSSHDYSKRQHEAIHEYKKCVDHMARKSGVDLYISLFCEHNLSADVVIPLVEQARDYSIGKKYTIPTFVNTPEHGQFVSDQEGIINEVHGVMPSKPALKQGESYIVSPDGEELNGANAGNYNTIYSDSQIRFAWDQTLNCRRGKQRSMKYCPTAEHIVELAKLLRVIGVIGVRLQILTSRFKQRDGTYYSLQISFLPPEDQRDREMENT